MKKRMVAFLRRLHADRRGAMSVEKILILGLIAVPVLIVLLGFAQWGIKYFQDKSKTLGDESQTTGN